MREFSKISGVSLQKYLPNGKCCQSKDQHCGFEYLIYPGHDICWWTWFCKFYSTLQCTSLSISSPSNIRQFPSEGHNFKMVKLKMKAQLSTQGWILLIKIEADTTVALIKLNLTKDCTWWLILNWVYLLLNPTGTFVSGFFPDEKRDISLLWQKNPSWRTLSN